MIFLSFFTEKVCFSMKSEVISSIGSLQEPPGTSRNLQGVIGKKSKSHKKVGKTYIDSVDFMYSIEFMYSIDVLSIFY